MDREILLITPSIHMGGMQRAMVNIANEMVAKGVKVTLLSLYKLNHFFDLDQRIKFIEPGDELQKLNKVNRIRYNINYIKENFKATSARKVLVFGRFYSAITLVALKGLNAEVFISDRASMKYRDIWYVHFFSKLTYQFLKPKGIICQTNDSLAFQKKNFGSEVSATVIPNPVISLDIPKLERENIVLAVGRFGDSLKGFDRLIEAWCIMSKTDWKLIFIGGDEKAAEKEGYIERLRSCGKLDSVKFEGKVKDPVKWYALSKLFVIPSRSEGFPNALLEAMSAHVACIAFDFNSGPKDLIRHMENGFLVKEGDIKALAAGIEFLMQNENIRNQLAQANNYKNEFSPEKIVEKFINYIFMP